MKPSYSTSLYIGTMNKSVPSISEIRKELWNAIKSATDNKGFGFNDEKQIITKGSLQICFSVLYTADSNHPSYMAAFRPFGNVNLFGRDSLAQSEAVLSFCSLLGSQVQVLTNPPVTFFRRAMAGNDRVDISYWGVDCPYSSDRKKTTVLEFRSSAVNTAVNAVPRNNEMYIFSDTYVKGAVPLQELQKKIGIYGKIYGPDTINSARWTLSSIPPRNKQNSIFVFLEDQTALEKHYINDKIYFDSNSMPTQYIRANTVTGKFPTLPGVNANFILEMLTKMGRQPVKLIAPSQVFTNDGFLCLSDIESVGNRLFGAIFTYAKQGLEKLTEEVHLYDNIKFETPTDYTIDVSEESLPLLVDNISGLVGRNSIDVLLTKRWKPERIEQLKDLLLRKQITIKKVYYISSRTCRFVDDYLLDVSNKKSLSHPYIIVNEKIGYLKTCTDVRIYNNLFSLFIELQYPASEKLTQSDMDKLLWLTKKRIYRIQEFYVLKNPEPIYVFRNLRKMYVGKIGTANTIQMRLLI